MREEYTQDPFDDVFLEAHRVLGKRGLFKFLYEDVHLTSRWITRLFRVSPNTVNGWLSLEWGSREQRHGGYTHYQNHMTEVAIKAWLIPQLVGRIEREGEINA